MRTFSTTLLRMALASSWSRIGSLKSSLSWYIDLPATFSSSSLEPNWLIKLRILLSIIVSTSSSVTGRESFSACKTRALTPMACSSTMHLPFAGTSTFCRCISIMLLSISLFKIILSPTTATILSAVTGLG